MTCRPLDRIASSLYKALVNEKSQVNVVSIGMTDESILKAQEYFHEVAGNIRKENPKLAARVERGTVFSDGKIYSVIYSTRLDRLKTSLWVWRFAFRNGTICAVLMLDFLTMKEKIIKFLLNMRRK